MSYIWRQASESPITVRQVFEHVRQEREIAYITIMTIMNRLADKGLLTRTKEGKAHLYTPQTSQQQTVKSLVHQTLQSLVNQFGHEAITAFADELQQLPVEEQRFFANKFNEIKN